MPNEAETAIYNRLHAAPTFHPADVRLLPDTWALEPGDIVTVTNDEDSYSMPIYSMDLDWKGDSVVSVQSTGNRQRDPLAVLSHRQYGAGSGGYGAQKAQETQFKEYNTHFEQTDEYFSLLATQSEWDELAQEGHVTAYSEIFQNSSTISGIVSAVGADGTVTAASICTAIRDGGSGVWIQADKIYLNGDTVAEKLTAQSATISNLVAGRAKADAIWSGLLQADSRFNYQGYNASWRQFTFLNDSGVAVTARFLIAG